MTILDRIASGPNILGSIAQGQGIGQNILAGRQIREQQALDQQRRETMRDAAMSGAQGESFQELAAVDPKSAAFMRGIFNGMRNDQIKKSFLDLVVGYGTKKEDQKEYFGRIATQMPEDAPIKGLFEDLATTDDHDERGTKNLRGIEMGKNTGYLGGGKQSQKQKTGAHLVKDPKTGKHKIVAGILDTGTGGMELASASLGDLEPVSKLGETAKEQTTRKVSETREKAAVKGEEKTAIDIINKGLDAAETTPVLRKSLELANIIKTGGLAGISQKIKSKFGIQGKDETELTYNLAKNVLQQLKPTFGAAFSKAEFQALLDIEAGLGTSMEGNIAILKQTLAMAETKAAIARGRALERNQKSTVSEIDQWLSKSLMEEQPATQGAEQDFDRVYDAQGRRVQ